VGCHRQDPHIQILISSSFLLLELVQVNKPGQRFSELEESLLGVGVFTSDQVILLPEEVLAIIGNMGLARARILCNYAKRAVLPLLGLDGDYDEAEIDSHNEEVSWLAYNSQEFHTNVVANIEDEGEESDEQSDEQSDEETGETSD
jgi:hypothetical protein